MKKIFISLLLAVCVAASASTALAKKSKALRVQGGTNIGDAGVSIDASYDKRLDAFAPGYKVINVAIINESFNIVMLDPDNDKWAVKLEGDKRGYTAIHDLRSQDPKTWSSLPEKARDLVAYPLALPIGAHEVIDIFVPETLDLERFNELDVFIKSLGGKLEVMVRQ